MRLEMMTEIINVLTVIKIISDDFYEGKFIKFQKLILKPKTPPKYLSANAYGIICN